MRPFPIPTAEKRCRIHAQGGGEKKEGQHQSMKNLFLQGGTDSLYHSVTLWKQGSIEIDALFWVWYGSYTQ